MATKDSNISTMNKNKETIKKVSSKIHEELLNTSHLFIDETVATLSKMQRITGKVIKKSEPILEKQIDITFDTVEAIKNQAEKGGKRALKLFGLTRQFNKLSDSIEDKIKEIPSVEEVIEDAKEFVGKAKSDVEDKIGEISEKLNIAKVEEAVEAKTKKTVKRVKTSTAKAKTAAAKKVSAKTKTAVKKSTPVAKTKVVKTAKKAVAVKTANVTSELTKIKGIGASLANIMTDNGIKTLEDLKKAKPAAINNIAAKAGNRYKSFDTKKWIAAAKAIAK